MLSAPDKWRGSVTSAEVSAAVGRAAARAGWYADPAPVSDGGEGFVEALGGPNRSNRVTGPLGVPVDAAWILRDEEALIEMASASGLALVGGAKGNDPRRATSRGTGELISVALDTGATRIVVGLGGSASTDGGYGCFEVLRSDSRLAHIQLIAACDVMVPFARALRFASQKGASTWDRLQLAARLNRVAEIYEAECGVDVRATPGAGAAGGLGGALAALGGRLVSGIQFVADVLRLEERMVRADLVVTGEGKLDAPSFDGKAVGWILDRARVAGTPVLVVVGARENSRARVIEDGAVEVVSLAERYGLPRARSNTLECIEAVVDEYLSHQAGARSPSP